MPVDLAQDGDPELRDEAIRAEGTAERDRRDLPQGGPGGQGL
jgi:hypothetical protein